MAWSKTQNILRLGILCFQRALSMFKSYCSVLKISEYFNVKDQVSTMFVCVFYKQTLSCCMDITYRFLSFTINTATHVTNTKIRTPREAPTIIVVVELSPELSVSSLELLSFLSSVSAKISRRVTRAGYREEYGISCYNRWKGMVNCIHKCCFIILKYYSTHLI